MENEFPIGSVVEPANDEEADWMGVPFEAKGIVIKTDCVYTGEYVIFIKWENNIIDKFDNSCGWYITRFKKTSNIPSTQKQNNEGRSNCLWCKAPTSKVQGFTEFYTICSVCKR